MKMSEVNINQQFQEEINHILADTINKNVKYESLLKESMTYSLIDGGKRIRPLLFMLLLDAYGIDYHEYKKVICAIEMIHTYSLIHDDLPGMDNDSLRRGKPTNHIQFGEDVAILAGDALLTDAFYQLSSITNLDSDKVIKLIRTLSLAAGSNGMVYGQQLDLEQHLTITLEQVEKIYYYKTCLMIQASLAMAAIIADQPIDDLMSLGSHLGQAFQIQDDLFEYTKTSEEIGKDADSDAKNNKTTIVSLIGQERATLLVESYFDQIDIILSKLGLTGTKFHYLILEISDRQR